MNKTLDSIGGWILSVWEWFNELNNNLHMSSDVVSKVRYRYAQITKRINIEYWNSQSENTHSLYVGSYGRGTAIYTSDIDIIVWLPSSVKDRFDGNVGNVQSKVLQEVKNKLMKTYATSIVSGDGQVVVIDFSDGIRFEIVPAFENFDKSFTYPDTHNGGSWKNTNPRKIMNSFDAMNSANSGELKKFARMIRSMNEKMDCSLGGILIDTMVYDFFKGYQYAKNGFSFYDWKSRDFFKYIFDAGPTMCWRAPGTAEILSQLYPYLLQGKMDTAHETALKAISYEKNNPDLAKAKWRDIYGVRFPR